MLSVKGRAWLGYIYITYHFAVALPFIKNHSRVLFQFLRKLWDELVSAHPSGVFKALL